MDLQSQSDFPALTVSSATARNKRRHAWGPRDPLRGGAERREHDEDKRLADIVVYVDNALSGELLAVVQVREDGTAMDLKRAAEEALPKRQLTLTFGDAVLDDAGKLSEYGIVDNTHVVGIAPHLMIPKQVVAEFSTCTAFRGWVGCAAPLALHEIADIIVSAGSATSPNAVGVWSAERGEAVCSLEGHSSSVLSVAIQDDTIASSGKDMVIRLWSLSSHECTAVLEGHESDVTGLAMNGAYLVSACKQYCKTWSLPSKECIATSEELREDRGANPVVAVTESYIVGANGIRIKVWPLGSAVSAHTFLTTNHAYVASSVSAVKDMFVVGAGDFVEMFRVSIGQRIEVSVLTRWGAHHSLGHPKITKGVSLAGGLLAIGFDARSIELWKVSKQGKTTPVGALTVKASSSTSAGTTVQLSPCGCLVSLNLRHDEDRGNGKLNVWWPEGRSLPKAWNKCFK